MRRIIGLLTLVAVAIVATAEIMCGGNASVSRHISEFGVLAMAAPAVTLDTQKIVFLTSLKEEYEQIDTWLNEAEDLSAFVEHGQTLVFPEAGADPAVYKNRVTDIDYVEPKETVFKSDLDVYDSQNYKIRNIFLHALPFEKVQHYTRKSAKSIIKQQNADAAFTFAPTNAGRKKIILPTTGDVRDGIKMFRLDDIAKLARACDNEEFPDGRNLVLTSDMWWDLVLQNDILKAQLMNSQHTGRINPSFVEYHGIKIHKSLGEKLGIVWDLSIDEKADQGTLADVSSDLVPASLFFCANQVFRAGGNMEMFYLDKSTNPSGRAYEFGFQHRFKADFQMDAERYSGLVYLDKA
ncbi:MAG: hypothetical protein FWC10_03600 [Lentimicrobiaceae bacterium]|nr:hypothetical protein [Lentimicrobiaceae bacterium]MCL2246180.1 hypothetical protein [Lentimicrobiaceae bacterium]